MACEARRRRWPQPRDPGDRSRELRHVPGGALWRHAEIGPAGSSPARGMGRGPSYASVSAADRGATPAGDRRIGEDERVRPLGPPPRAPSQLRQVLPLSPLSRSRQVSMGTAAGSARPGAAPLLAQLPMTETGRNMGWGTDHRLGPLASAVRSPRRAHEGPLGDPHRHRPYCAGHSDWPALSRRGSILWCARSHWLDL